MFGGKERQRKKEEAILGVLGEAKQPLHAYAIAKMLFPENPTPTRWGTLYGSLRHLVELGLVERTIDEAPYDYPGPPRRYYAIVPQNPFVQETTNIPDDPSS